MLRCPSLRTVIQGDFQKCWDTLVDKRDTLQADFDTRDVPYLMWCCLYMFLSSTGSFFQTDVDAEISFIDLIVCLLTLEVSIWDIVHYGLTDHDGIFRSVRLLI